MGFADKYLQSLEVIGLRIDGAKIHTGQTHEVTSPYSNEQIAKVSLASNDELQLAIEIAYKAFLAKTLTTDVRAKVLDKASQLLEKNSEEFAKIISSESAKPIKTARIEVERAVQTFLFSASVARNLSGEMVALDAHPSGQNKLAFTLREPIGVIAAISPFNFPLNLVVHKVAPAIAAGCPVVLKPAHNTPLTSAALVDLLLDECGLPSEMLSFVPCTGEVASNLTQSDKVAMISFTGSPGVGWSIREKAPKKKVALELGNNAPVIVEADADLEKVSTAIVASGYSFQGQSCISVQRVFAHKSIMDQLLESLKEKISKLVVGDPLDDATDVSALISASETTRVKNWIDEAVSGGAQLVVGGDLNQDSVLLPTLLVNTKDEMKVCRNEVFGPVVSIMEYESLEDAIARSNDSDYGLQAAIFTSNIKNAIKAARGLDFGGVLINETPTFRADNMPYGGIRDSGNTKEGPAYTVHEMTVEKLVIINET